jgi:hypothetical protein
MHRRGLCLIFLTFSLFAAAAHGSDFDQIEHRWTSAGKIEEWTIHQPDVTVRTRDYRQIVFRNGDKVEVNAGGCVQTGGKGKTWKRYVNPSGPNSERYYFGQFGQPGHCGGQMLRMSEAIGKRFAADLDSKIDCDSRVSPTLMFLRLGYADDRYGDNGYWSHDDGTENQCRDIGPAWVTVKITHP